MKHLLFWDCGSYHIPKFCLIFRSKTDFRIHQTCTTCLRVIVFLMQILFFFIWIYSLFLSFSSYYILNTLIYLIILFNRPSLSLLWLLWFCCIVWIDFPNQIFAVFIKMKYVVLTKDSATLKRKNIFSHQ